MKEELTNLIKGINSENYVFGKSNMLFSKNINIAKIEKILISSPNLINERDINNKTALYYTIETGRVDLLNLLIKYNVNLDEIDNDGQTPSHYAARFGHVKILKTLIKKKNENTEKKIISEPPLKKARRTKPEESTEKAILDTKDNFGKTPLDYATDHKHIEIILILIKDWIDINDKRKPSQMLSRVSTKDRKINIESFLRENLKLDIKDKQGKILPFAAQDEFGQTLLHYAADYGYIEIVEFLVNEGIDIEIQDIDGETALYYAVKKGKKDIVEFLVIDNRANVNIKNKNDKAPLHYASASIDIIKLLLEYGADVNATNHGRTILHYISNLNKAIIKVLLKYNANINVKDNCNATILHKTAFENNIEATRFCVEKNVNTEAQDDIFEQTALHFAVSLENMEMVTILAKKSNIDIQDKDGYTALHLAVLKENIKIVRFLKDNMANINLRDKHNKTPLKYAIENQSEEIIEILREEQMAVNDVKLNQIENPQNLCRNNSASLENTKSNF